MLDLHKRGLIPSHTQQYIVERIATGGKTLFVYTSLEPWGHYQVYNYAQMFDEAVICSSVSPLKAMTPIRPSSPGSIPKKPRLDFAASR